MLITKLIKHKLRKIYFELLFCICLIHSGCHIKLNYETTTEKLLEKIETSSVFSSHMTSVAVKNSESKIKILCLTQIVWVRKTLRKISPLKPYHNVRTYCQGQPGKCDPWAQKENTEYMKGYDFLLVHYITLSSGWFCILEFVKITENWRKDN